MDPLPRTMILQPVSASSCLAVRPRGPRILPTKLNCEEPSKGRENESSFSGKHLHFTYLLKIWNGSEIICFAVSTWLNDVRFYHFAHTIVLYVHSSNILIIIELFNFIKKRSLKTASVERPRQPQSHPQGYKAQTIIPSANGSPIWKLWQSLT